MKWFSFGMLICAVLAPVVAGKPSDKNEGYARPAAARPMPRLDDLAERAKPDLFPGQRRVPNDVSHEAFWDLLKLRETAGPPEAVPVLEQILKDHAGSGRIHRYAASQALFRIGTPEARRVLEAQVFTPDFNVGLACNYTFHWEMAEPGRSQYIGYLLRNLAKDLEATLELEPEKEGEDPHFLLTLRNISTQGYWIQGRNLYQGMMIYYRSKDGRFFIGHETKVYDAPFPEPFYLPEQGTHSFRIGVFGTFDVAYSIVEDGIYEAIALFEEKPQPRTGTDKWWVGRAVSKPVKVEKKRKSWF